MKKVFILIFLFMYFSCNDDDSQSGSNQKNSFKGEVDWIRNFGGSGDETAQAVIQTSDGGFAVLGYTNSMDGELTGKDTPVNDYWLVKLDANGDMQWNKTYGGSKDDRGQSIIQTTDGGYAIVGYAMSDDGDGSNNEGFHDNWIVRLDALGNILWEKSFGFSGHDHSYDVVETSDGGFFFAGFLDVTQSEGAGNFGKGTYLTRHGVGEFWGTKLDESGNLEWRRYFGGTNNDRAHGAVQADDGGFVMAGFSESDDFDISNTKGSYDFWVVKVDETGTMLWEKSFGGSGIEISYDITKTRDGGYAIIGNTFSSDLDVSKNNGESDVWLIKIDNDGNLVWEKTFGGSGFDAARGIKTTLDGGFIIAGNSKSTDGIIEENRGENDFWVIKTDAYGNLEYQQTFGGSDLDFGFDALETSNGNILLVGETTSKDLMGIDHKGGVDLIIIYIR
ncbi:DNA helicase [Flagellimonas maritima]|uniref:DNA helicase n=1 Tax=Flagellimonas maritima TaxID=1383885 RepID=A0A2Z4LRU7_9FLAO|nr:hypothetical protein [Allomuricauda aurantiaca]AWX44631.1 DNA helicase [Allomuricauda aurantiaca]